MRSRPIYRYSSGVMMIRTDQVPETHSYTAARSDRVVRVLLVILVLISLICGGIYVAGELNDRKLAAELRDQIARNQERANRDEYYLQEAIRNGQAIIGMTASEVYRARGKPYIIQPRNVLVDAQLELGGVENWIYQDADGVKGILFGANGLVVYSSDVAGKPRIGNVIRER